MSTQNKNQLRQLLVGGILPVVAYTVVEETLGIMWGLVAGMVIGLAEMAYEWVTQRKVSAITAGATALIVGLGAISLFTQEGFWFKMQPAIMEGVMAVVLLASSGLGKPFMVMLADKQGMFGQVNPVVAPILRQKFSGLNFRLGIFFLLHTGLAVYAALYWSTRAWAFLKGLGFTGSLILYMLIEVVLLRRRLASEFSRPR